MDSTSRSVLHNTDLSATIGLTLDYTSQTLYWIDQRLDRLESSSTDGTNRRLLTTVSIQCPYGITVFDQKLYWTDTCQNDIFSTFLSAPNGVSSLVDTGNVPYHIEVISEEKQPINGKSVLHALQRAALEELTQYFVTGTNPCLNSNGGCSHICLLSATNSSGYSCACPDSLVLDENQRDCISECLIWCVTTSLS